jgi:hypothetical protein
MITDRSETDLSYAKVLKEKIIRFGFKSLDDDEKTEYMKGLKGTYNYIDLNRVESAVNEIVIELKKLGIDLDLVTKVDWNFEDLAGNDDKTQMDRYIGNVKKLKNWSYWVSSPPIPKSMNNLDVKNANNIEEFLQKVYNQTEKFKDVYYFCDQELFCGDYGNLMSYCDEELYCGDS